MGIFRSENMCRGTFVAPADRLHDYIERLGYTEKIEFSDMNETTMRRPYNKYIHRIDEMERILRYLTEETKRFRPAYTDEEESFGSQAAVSGLSFDSVAVELADIYRDIVCTRENNQQLIEETNSTMEYENVLKVCLAEIPVTSTRSARVSLLNLDETFSTSSKVALQDSNEYGGLSSPLTNKVGGVILRSDEIPFSRALFRCSRGNTFISFSPMTRGRVFDDASSNNKNIPVIKSIFLICFLGDMNSAMFAKINCVCKAFGSSVYTIPEDSLATRESLRNVLDRLEDNREYLSAFEKFMRGKSEYLLNRPSGSGLRCPRLKEWRMFCAKEKQIYATMNRFEGDSPLVRADCWFPEKYLHTLQEMIRFEDKPFEANGFLILDRDGAVLSSQLDMKRLVPPTFIRKTEFSYAFQEMIDTYGIASYGEVNPAVFTIITFPFLFGVMFGDMGHGLCLLLLGITITTRAKEWRSSQNEMLRNIVQARFMLMMMGAFSVYAGLMYNDFFGLGLNIFGSQWTLNHKSHQFVRSFDRPYPIGLDPSWKGAANELLFANSFKMKFSVIVGVTQMTLGILLKGCNAIHFRRPMDFFLEFIPQMMFMLSLFGYMDVLICLKWLSRPQHIDRLPSLISVMVNWAMMKPVESSERLFVAQSTVQRFLLWIAIASVPLMLIPKPLLLLLKHRRTSSRIASTDRGLRYLEEGSTRQTTENMKSRIIEDNEEGKFDFSDVFMHQLIETIEFVLGSVSNTASYLRLWALSLAHQQLAIVFFEKTILSVLQISSPLVRPFALYVAFGLFAGITVGVLMCMDVMECFLHALRLQWVEFQNKFYKAEGYEFKPYSHRRALDAAKYNQY